LKAEVLAEERHHMVLEAISHRAGVSALVLFEAVRDAVPVENVVQLGGIDA
jgi:hypothetical protein